MMFAVMMIQLQMEEKIAYHLTSTTSLHLFYVGTYERKILLPTSPLAIRNLELMSTSTMETI